jgi:hypothetical protein
MTEVWDFGALVEWAVRNRTQGEKRTGIRRIVDVFCCFITNIFSKLGGCAEHSEEGKEWDLLE